MWNWLVPRMFRMFLLRNIYGNSLRLSKVEINNTVHNHKNGEIIIKTMLLLNENFYRVVYKSYIENKISKSQIYTSSMEMYQTKLVELWFSVKTLVLESQDSQFESSHDSNYRYWAVMHESANVS